MDFIFGRRLNRADSVSIAIAAVLLTRGHWIIMLAVVLVMSAISVAGEALLARARGEQP